MSDDLRYQDDKISSTVYDETVEQCIAGHLEHVGSGLITSARGNAVCMPLDELEQSVNVLDVRSHDESYSASAHQIAEVSYSIYQEVYTARQSGN